MKKKTVESEDVVKPSPIVFTDNQKSYFGLLTNTNISLVVGLGPAGCGKTLLACNAGVLALKNRLVDKIIITRPAVSVDEELGFLPGSFEMKMDPWTRPIFDVLRESFSNDQIQVMMNNRWIEICPLAYMRGRTFKKAFIIADEMQNSSPNQMKMALTRIGEGSKMVITGDLNQSDRVGENGLSDFVFKLKNSGSDELSEIAYIELGRTDIRRSSVVSKIIDIYEPVVSKKETSIGLFDGFNEYDIEKNRVDSDAALIPKKDYKF